MPASVFSTRRLGGGFYTVRGIVDGEERTITAHLGDDPSMDDCLAALAKGESVPAPAVPAEPEDDPNASTPEDVQAKVVSAENNATPPPEGVGGDVSAATEGTAAEVSERLSAITDPDELDRMDAAESAGKDRKTVHDAIAARKAALA